MRRTTGRPLHPETGPDADDVESPFRMPPAQRDSPYEDPREYETVSVFEDFAADPSVFFLAAQTVCGICLTWRDDARDPGNGYIDDQSG